MANPMRRALTCTTLAAVILLVLNGTTNAAFLGDILKPFVTASEMYDSNVFRVKDLGQLQAMVGDEQLYDFITMVTVGTQLHYSISRQELNLLLKRDFIFYAHYTDQNIDQNEASGNLALTFFDKVKMRIDGAYKTAPEPHVDYRSAAVNERTNISYGVSLGYEMMSGIGFEAAYRGSEVDYSLAQYKPNEYSVDTFSGKVSYRLSPDARIYAAYHRDDTDYKVNRQIGSETVNNGSAADSIRLGLEKTFSPKTSVSCYVGYLERRHNSDSARDFDGLVGKAEINYGLTGKIGLMLNWERQLYEETYADQIYSVTDAIGAGLAYAITEKTKATIYNRVTWKDFQGIAGSGVATRSDFLHDLNVGFEWTPIKRLTVNLGYQYSMRSSDDSSFDFTDHTVTTSVGYKF